jgi:redox-sensing transcriptional repressor
VTGATTSCTRSQARSLGAVTSARRRHVPDATVARLPLYLRSLHALAEEGATTVSSEELARLVGGGAGGPAASARVRKDLSHLGTYGTRGVGYDVAQLVDTISAELGLARRWPVVLVGAGNLGSALAGYGGFASRGFRIAALLDADPARVGELVGGLPVRPMADLPGVVAEQGGAIGVIATPADAAQEVCDALVAAGVRSVLNFAPTALVVPDGVDVRKVDLAVELQILSFHEHRRARANESRDAREEVPA